MSSTNPPESQRFFHSIGGKSVATGREATRLIRELAERQHGVVAHRQLIDMGLGKMLIHSRLEGGRLVPLYQGVYALGHRRLTQRGEWMAAVLACGPGAVLSHGSAAHLWDMRGSRGPIEVTRRSGHRRPHGVLLHQTRSLPPEDIFEEAGIPITSIERTVLDMAGRLDDRQLEHMLVAADRSGRLNWSRLRRVLDAAGGKRGRRRLRRVAAQVDPSAIDTKSPLEIDFLALCRKARLPTPHVNVWVEGKLADFYWPQAKVIVETDSYTFHGDRLAFERDHESTVALEVLGYRVHRATYNMLKHHPGQFLRLVRASLQT
jgi:very-short-patch-repair endonuclease